MSTGAEERRDSQVPEEALGDATSVDRHRERVAVPKLQLWPIHVSVALAILGAVVFIIAFVIVAFWLAGFPSVKRDDSVSSTTIFDLLKLAFAVVAGTGGIVALIVAYRRQRVVEAANKLAEINAALAHLADARAEAAKLLAEAADQRASIENDRGGIRLLNERFTKAAEQLGSDHPAIRLAGAYSLASLADDWEKERQTCIDVLCGYLRMAPGQVEGDDEVRRTIARIIVSRLRIRADPSWQGYTFDLAGSQINEWDFRDLAIQRGTFLNFEGANFDTAGRTPSFQNVTALGGSLKLARINFTRGIELSGIDVHSGSIDFTSSEFRSFNFALRRGRVKDGSLIFKQCKFENQARFGSTPGGRLRIDKGRVDFTLAKFEGGTEGIRSCSLNLNMYDGSVTFDNATFTGRGLSFSESILTGGKVILDFVATEEGDTDFSDVQFRGAVVDFSKAYKWARPPLMPESGAPSQLKLPSPDWKFELEPPF